jgi:hypothetical protein
MFARIATFEGVDIEAAESVMEEARVRIEPMMKGIAGSRGYMQLVDRENGKSVTIAFFDSAESMNEAERVFDEDMPKQLGDLFGEWAGRRTSVQRYEIVEDERF